jgi:hypothetical protein
LEGAVARALHGREAYAGCAATSLHHFRRISLLTTLNHYSVQLSFWDCIISITQCSASKVKAIRFITAQRALQYVNQIDNHNN